MKTLEERIKSNKLRQQLKGDCTIILTYKEGNPNRVIKIVQGIIAEDSVLIGNLIGKTAGNHIQHMIEDRYSLYIDYAINIKGVFYE